MVGGHRISASTFAYNGKYLVSGDQEGILLNQSSGDTVWNNQVYNNRVGIIVYGATADKIGPNNNVYGNVETGIQVGAAPNSGTIFTTFTTVQGNQVHDNGGIGIRIGGLNAGTSNVQNAVVQSNTLAGNNMSTGRYQIDFAGTVSSSTVSANTVTHPGACYPDSYGTIVVRPYNTCVPWNAYSNVQAESFELGTDVCPAGGALGCLDTGDYVRYNVDFGYPGAKSVRFRLAVDNCCAGRRIEVRSDSPSGPVLGSASPSATGSWTSFIDTLRANISPTSGVHDIYLVFSGGYGVANIDWFMFSPDSLPPRSAYQTIQAESYNDAYDICFDGGAIGCLDYNDYAHYADIDFGPNGARSVIFNIGVDGCCAGREVQIRLGSTSGTLIGTLRPTATGSWSSFKAETTAVALTTGRQHVYLVFQGGYGVGNIDWLVFSTAPPPARNPYLGIEAESFDYAPNVCVDSRAVGCLDGGDVIRFDNVDFGSGGVYSLKFQIAVDWCCWGGGRQIQVWLDGTDYSSGQLIASIAPSVTGSWTTFTEQFAQIFSSSYTGSHTVYIVAVGSYGIGNIDRLTFYH